MGGSEHNGGTRDERGTLIPFPRSGWIPADGIEPFNTGDLQPGSTSEAGSGAQAGAEQTGGSATIEADDFWASGDTQEFVGVASPADGSGPAPVAGASGVRHRSARPQALVGSAAAVLIAVAGVAAWQVSSSAGGSPKRSANFAASARHSPSGTYAATTRRTRPGLHATEARQLHRSTLSSHPKARVNETARHRAKAVHRDAATPQIVPVSYERSATANSPANTSSGSSAVASSPPQTPGSATTASASGGSVSGSTAAPAQPGPNGALTCVSNCG